MTDEEVVEAEMVKLKAMLEQVRAVRGEVDAVSKKFDDLGLPPASNVVPFPGVTNFKAPICEQPEESVITTLEQAFELAKAGKIQAAAIAWVQDDLATSYQWAWAERNASWALMWASVCDMHHELAVAREKLRRGEDVDDDPPDESA